MYERQGVGGKTQRATGGGETPQKQPLECRLQRDSHDHERTHGGGRTTNICILPFFLSDKAIRNEFPACSSSSTTASLLELSIPETNRLRRDGQNRGRVVSGETNCFCVAVTW